MSIQYRFAGLSDSTLILDWRNDPTVRHNSRDKSAIPIEMHTSWFSSRIDNFRTEPIIIFSKDGTDIGFTRLDLIDAERGVLEVSIAVALNMRSKGFGSFMLKMTVEAARRLPNAREIKATVRSDNYVSLRLFESCGFKKISESLDFVNLGLVFSEQFTD
jgi:RimJ/RimL family protein N-acetyltransferase